MSAMRHGIDIAVRNELAKSEEYRGQRTAVADQKKVGAENKKQFCERLDFDRGGRGRDVGVAGASATAAHANSDSKREDRAIDRPTRAEFRERPFHSVVGRWKTGGRHSAEPALWRIRFGRTAHRVGTRVAEYGSASADVDAADRKGGEGLYFHRELE